MDKVKYVECFLTLGTDGMAYGVSSSFYIDAPEVDWSEKPAKPSTQTAPEAPEEME